MSTDDPELTVRLPKSVWLAAVDLMATLPYGQVSALIETVAEQLGPQIRATQATDTPTTADARPN